MRELGSQGAAGAQSVVRFAYVDTYVSLGVEFLGDKVKQGIGHRVPSSKRWFRSNSQNLYAIPRQKSVQRVREQIRHLTRQQAPLRVQELIERLNPGMRGWGTFYRNAEVRRLFHQLDQ
jgi:RNA-directed DNA polymerase